MHLSQSQNRLYFVYLYLHIFILATTEAKANSVRLSSIQRDVFIHEGVARGYSTLQHVMALYNTHFSPFV